MEKKKEQLGLKVYQEVKIAAKRLAEERNQTVSGLFSSLIGELNQKNKKS